MNNDKKFQILNQVRIEQARIQRERILNETDNGSVPLVGIDFDREQPIHIGEYFVKAAVMVHLN